MYASDLIRMKAAGEFRGSGRCQDSSAAPFGQLHGLPVPVAVLATDSADLMRWLIEHAMSHLAKPY